MLKSHLAGHVRYGNVPDVLCAPAEVRAGDRKLQMLFSFQKPWLEISLEDVTHSGVAAHRPLPRREVEDLRVRAQLRVVQEDGRGWAQLRGDAAALSDSSFFPELPERSNFIYSKKSRQKHGSQEHYSFSQKLVPFQRRSSPRGTSRTRTAPGRA